MPPAAGALFLRRFRDRGTWFRGGFEAQIAKNKEFFEFLARDGTDQFFVAAKHNCRFKRIPDQFFLARLFNRLSDYAAQFQQLVDLLPNERVAKVVLRLGKKLKVD